MASIVCSLTLLPMLQARTFRFSAPIRRWSPARFRAAGRSRSPCSRASAWLLSGPWSGWARKSSRAQESSLTSWPLFCLSCSATLSGAYFRPRQGPIQVDFPRVQFDLRSRLSAVTGDGSLEPRSQIRDRGRLPDLLRRQRSASGPPPSAGEHAPDQGHVIRPEDEDPCRFFARADGGHGGIPGGPSSIAPRRQGHIFPDRHRERHGKPRLGSLAQLGGDLREASTAPLISCRPWTASAGAWPSYPGLSYTVTSEESALVGVPGVLLGPDQPQGPGIRPQPAPRDRRAASRPG